MRKSIRLFSSSLLLFAAHFAAAQESPAEVKGFTAYENFQVSGNSAGQIYKLDTRVGYDFNKHFELAIGVPFYFVRSRPEPGQPALAGSQNGLGNAYLSWALALDSPVLNFASTLTGTAPTGDKARGFSTGHATFSWNNHFDRMFWHATPFIDLGIANAISDSPFFVRPFTSHGLVGSLEAGTKLRLWSSNSLIASFYAVRPSGSQIIVSRVAKPRPVVPRKHNSKAAAAPVVPPTQTRVVITSVEAQDIARDQGYSLGFESALARSLDLQIGYTHSIRFALDTFFVGMGVDTGSLVRKMRHH